MRRMTFKRRRKPMVKWVETKDLLVDSVVLYGPNVGQVGSDQTFVFPLFTDPSDANDKSDVRFDETTASILGVSDWGTAIGALYETGYKCQRALGMLSFAIQQRIESAGASPVVNANNIVVRCGIFCGETDESGVIKNSGDYLLHQSDSWKDRRWLFQRDWLLHNAIGPTTQGGFGNWADTSFIAVADMPRVVWGPPSSEFYQSATSNGRFDIKPKVPVGNEQRLFFAFCAYDSAQGPKAQASMSTSWTLVWRKHSRGLWSRTASRARKT